MSDYDVEIVMRKFKMGWSSWVRFAERPEAPGPMQDGWDMAAEDNEISGDRPRVADADDACNDYMKSKGFRS